MQEFQIRKWNLYLCNQVISLVVNVFMKDMLFSVVFQTSSSYRNRQINMFGINQPLLEENKSTKNGSRLLIQRQAQYSDVTFTAFAVSTRSLPGACPELSERGRFSMRVYFK